MFRKLLTAFESSLKAAKQYTNLFTQLGQRSTKQFCLLIQSCHAESGKDLGQVFVKADKKLWHNDLEQGEDVLAAPCKCKIGRLWEQKNIHSFSRKTGNHKADFTHGITGKERNY